MCGCGIEAPCYGCSCGCTHGTPEGLREQLERMHSIYSPKPPSLRDEVVAAMSESWAERDGWEAAADAVLAVVRRHIEGLDRHGFVPGKPYMWATHPKGVWLNRDDVLRLLGGSDG